MENFLSEFVSGYFKNIKKKFLLPLSSRGGGEEDLKKPFFAVSLTKNKRTRTCVAPSWSGGSVCRPGSGTANSSPCPAIIRIHSPQKMRFQVVLTGVWWNFPIFTVPIFIFFFFAFILQFSHNTQPSLPKLYVLFCMIYSTPVNVLKVFIRRCFLLL